MKRPTHKDFLWSYGFCAILTAGLVWYWAFTNDVESLATTIAASVVSILAGLCVLQVVLAAIVVELGQRNSQPSFAIVRRLAIIGRIGSNTVQTVKTKKAQ